MLESQHQTRGLPRTLNGGEMSDERAFYFVLKNKQGIEVGQVEGFVRGGRFCFEVQDGYEMDDIKEFNVPINTFKKGAKRERYKHYQTTDGRSKNASGQPT
jgi:hypothetical protein